MTQNLITSAFELVRDVEHGVLLLDTFHRLANREVLLPILPRGSLCFPLVPPKPFRYYPACASGLPQVLTFFFHLSHDSSGFHTLRSVVPTACVRGELYLGMSELGNLTPQTTSSTSRSLGN